MCSSEMSPGSQATLAKIDEPITLRFYFSPRLGLAWAPTGKTSVRVGFGRFFTAIEGVSAGGMAGWARRSRRWLHCWWARSPDTWWIVGAGASSPA